VKEAAGTEACGVSGGSQRAEASEEADVWKPLVQEREQHEKSLYSTVVCQGRTAVGVRQGGAAMRCSSRWGSKAGRRLAREGGNSSFIHYSVFSISLTVCSQRLASLNLPFDARSVVWLRFRIAAAPGSYYLLE
jgi:hypothetical protein